jgi:Second Messenger Oligonucleotide or Dinucleotide Synthetase domain
MGLRRPAAAGGGWHNICMSTEPLEAFIRSLVPPQRDRSEVAARKATLERALEQSPLDAGYLFESGSWTHGTGIAGKSDVDYMAWASSPRPLRPSSALRSLEAAVEFCDWKIDSTRISSPVVAVTYESIPHFEVVPAWYKEEIRSYNVFWIPGRSDEWVLSAPQAHLAYVSDQNDRLDKRVKPLVRLLKAWKRHVGAPVSSFYLEMRTAQYASRESSIIYDMDLLSIFDKLLDDQCRDMNDPQGLVGRIPACSSEEKRRTAVKLAHEAGLSCLAADRARTAGNAGDYWEAMYDLFGEDFPWPAWT